MATKTFCDCCDKDITNINTRHLVLKYGGDIELNLELCYECYSNIFDLIQKHRNKFYNKKAK